jgi:hypothetical protein
MRHYRFTWTKSFHYYASIKAKTSQEAFEKMKKIIDKEYYEDYYDDEELQFLEYEGSYDANGTEWKKATPKDDNQFWEKFNE